LNWMTTRPVMPALLRVKVWENVPGVPIQAEETSIDDSLTFVPSGR
jgi:hypothetical protein